MSFYIHNTVSGNVQLLQTSEDLVGLSAEWSTEIPESWVTRFKRNDLLAETDWRASSDVTISDEWRTYRQALRDVPSQAGFPNTITWPTKPS